MKTVPLTLLSTWAGMTEILEVFIGHLTSGSIFLFCTGSMALVKQEMPLQVSLVKNFELPINIRIYYKTKRHSFKSPSERLFFILALCQAVEQVPKILGALIT